MKAIQLRQPGCFTTIEIPEPGTPSEGEALVAVRRVGICGTDIAAYLGKMPFVRYPLILGHELGVDVVAVGEGVTSVSVGDRCSVEPYLNCGECFACRRGRTNCCEKLEVLGVHIDGGMRPRLVVPARKLHPSAKLTLEQLALVETLAIGCHAVNRAQVEHDEWALVIGVGPIGLAVLEFLRLAGARIIVLDTNAGRLDLCRKTYEIEHVVRSNGDGSELGGNSRDARGDCYPALCSTPPDRSSRCAGQLTTWRTPGKLVSWASLTATYRFRTRCYTAARSPCYASRNALPHEFRWIIEQIEAGRIDTRPWITHRTGFDELIEAFPSFTRAETGVVKAMMEVD